MTGEYKRCIEKLKKGESLDVRETERLMKGNRDLFGQAVQVVDPFTRELREEVRFDVYRFSDQELYSILKKHNRLQKGEPAHGNGK